MRVPADDYITIEQFRQMWGYDTVQPVKSAIKQGRLYCIRFGREYLIPRNAIIDYSKKGASNVK